MILIAYHLLESSIGAYLEWLVSTKPGRQSTEGYAQGSRLSADKCASHERDGDAEQHAGLPRFRPPCGRNTLCPALLCYCCLEQCITS
jgi:hypothetical protein